MVSPWFPPQEPKKNTRTIDDPKTDVEAEKTPPQLAAFEQPPKRASDLCAVPNLELVSCGFSRSRSGRLSAQNARSDCKMAKEAGVFAVAATTKYASNSLLPSYLFHNF